MPGTSDVEEITDTISGVKASREGLDRLRDLVRKGQVDAGICFKLDRLGRRSPTWRKSLMN